MTNYEHVIANPELYLDPEDIARLTPNYTDKDALEQLPKLLEELKGQRQRTFDHLTVFVTPDNVKVRTYLISLLGSIDRKINAITDYLKDTKEGKECRYSPEVFKKKIIGKLEREDGIFTILKADGSVSTFLYI